MNPILTLLGSLGLLVVGALLWILVERLLGKTPDMHTRGETLLEKESENEAGDDPEDWNDAAAELTREMTGTYDTSLSTNPATGEVVFKKPVPETDGTGKPSERKPATGQGGIIHTVVSPLPQSSKWQTWYDNGQHEALAAEAENQKDLKTSKGLLAIAAVSAWDSGDSVAATRLAAEALEGVDLASLEESLDVGVLPTGRGAIRVAVPIAGLTTVTVTSTWDCLNYLKALGAGDDKHSWVPVSIPGAVCLMYKQAQEGKTLEQWAGFEAGSGSLGALAWAVKARAYMDAGKEEAAVKSAKLGLACSTSNPNVLDVLAALAHGQ